MTGDSIFTRVEPGLEPVFAELCSLEPIFHNQNFGMTEEAYRRAIGPGFWEVGASGRRYDSKFLLQALERSAMPDAATAGWSCTEFGIRALGLDTYLLTYTLNQAGRLTRRATIWRKSSEQWQILYHQGTVVVEEAQIKE